MYIYLYQPYIHLYLYISIHIKIPWRFFYFTLSLSIDKEYIIYLVKMAERIGLEWKMQIYRVGLIKDVVY